MKNKLLTAVMLGISLLTTAISFSQNVTINYQTWNPTSPPCDVFNAATNVPATINGTNGTIQHVSLIGDVKYSTSDQSIQLDNNYVSASDTRGTKYRLSYSFKVGYRYIITVTSAELTNTFGTGINPYLRLDLSNNGSIGGSSCVGAQSVTSNLSGNPPANPYSNTAFQDVQFSFSTALSTAFSTLEVTSIPAQSVSSNSIRIRKIIIAETAPTPTFTLTPSSLTVPCGSSTAQIFTVNNVYNSPGTLSYDWDLGSTGNGWLYNGNPAPQTFSTATNSISLTSSVSATSLSNVSVTVKLNGGNYTTLNSLTTVTNSIPNFTLSNITKGVDCNIITVKANLPLGNTITWTTTNGLLINGNASPYTTTYGNTFDVYSPGGFSGIVSAALGTGPCARQANNIISYCPCLPWTDPNPVLIYAPALRSDPLIAQVSELTGAWSYQWYIGGQLIAETYTGYLWTTDWPCMGNPRNLEVIAVTDCGRSASINIGEIFLECYGNRLSSSNDNDIKLSPNPAGNSIFITLNSVDRPNKLSNNRNTLSQILIFYNLGILKLSRRFANNLNQVEIDISKLNAGIYYIEVFDGKTKQRKQFIKK